jgi:regulator of sigma E protease
MINLLSLLHVVLAIIGFGFLVFIHELGHYWVARRKGMKVEAFSIGFGKPIYSWMRDGVKWQISWLPFGGYVKIAGMQSENGVEAKDIPDGYYGKSPWKRIQVAIAGPLVNIAFAMIVFTGLWMLGGRQKNYGEFTHRIGWVDPQSALYTKGVRPGDIVNQYDGRTFNGFKDLMMSSAMADKEINISGLKVDSVTGAKTPFNYTLPTYPNKQYKEKLKTIGLASPAHYLLFSGALPEGSALAGSGIEPGDRIVWADGDSIFSMHQLNALINESTVFFTVQRGSEVFQTKIPRVHIDDLKMASTEVGEVSDWQHETGIKGRLQDLTFVPYTFSSNCVVENRLDFIDAQDQKKAFQACQRCAYFNPLQEGDKVLAVDGKSVSNSYQLLQSLQTRRTLIIVERGLETNKAVTMTAANDQFENFGPNLQAIVGSIGTNSSVKSVGNLVLIGPVSPKPTADFMGPQIAAENKRIESIGDRAERESAIQALSLREKQAMLGIPLVDRHIQYNPSPLKQFKEVLVDTWRTLSGLFTGSLSPKFVSGPIGIVNIIQQSWLQGTKEAIYWFALISLNLGIMNLLPIPVLDGGHICFSLWEIIFRKPISAKVMERMIVPFVVLMIAIFVFSTFHDLSRLFSKFF